MDVTVTITDVCAGGNHVYVTVTKGAKTQQFVLLKSDLMAAGGDGFVVRTHDEALCKELRRFAKRQGINTFAQLKAACVDTPLSL